MKKCHNQRRILNVALINLVFALASGCGTQENHPPPKGDGVAAKQAEGAKVDVKDEMKGIQQNEAPVAPKDTYSSNEGLFSVAFPGTPEQAEEIVTAPLGRKAVSHNFVVRTGSSEGFMVSYSDLPEHITKTWSEKTLLDVSRDGLVEFLDKGRLVSEKEIFLYGGKRRGREILVQDSAAGQEKVFLRVQLFLVGDRVYQVGGIGPEGFVRGKKMEEFLMSFRVHK
jgi:hypothetical protein